jgi:hypothetical protein
MKNTILEKTDRYISVCEAVTKARAELRVQEATAEKLTTELRTYMEKNKLESLNGSKKRIYFAPKSSSELSVIRVLRLLKEMGLTNRFSDVAKIVKKNLIAIIGTEKVESVAVVTIEQHGRLKIGEKEDETI